MQDDIDSIREWIKSSHHHRGCASIFANAENVCTCGKTRALKELEEIEEVECRGDCEYASQADQIRIGLNDLINSERWSSMQRQEVKIKIAEIVK